MSNKTTRREFVRKSAVVAAGAIVLPQIIPSTALGMGGKASPGNRIVIATIGTGSQGTGNMQEMMKLKGRFQFVALCDVDRKHLEAGKAMVDKDNNNSDCRIYGDYRELLAKEKLDAVSIALPDHWLWLIYTEAVN